LHQICANVGLDIPLLIEVIFILFTLLFLSLLAGLKLDDVALDPVQVILRLTESNP
jgi:hypothetical protein